MAASATTPWPKGSDMVMVPVLRCPSTREEGKPWLSTGVGPLSQVLRPWRGAADRQTITLMDSEVPQSGSVIVGVDGSRAARRALFWAADEAQLRGAPL